MTDQTSIARAETAPEHPVFVKPAWGLTAHIPEGVTLAWGARAIYSWISVSRPIKAGSRLKNTTSEPSIDLLWDRMGWSSFGEITEASKAATKALASWIDGVGIPELKKICRREKIQPDDTTKIEFSTGDYTIVASPNGSFGYLYIAAWKAVS